MIGISTSMVNKITDLLYPEYFKFLVLNTFGFQYSLITNVTDSIKELYQLGNILVFPV
jgi:hypothetical protein